MKPRTHRSIRPAGKSLLMGGMLLILALALAVMQPVSQAQGDQMAPRYTVDPFWPKPLPTTTDASGVARQWITGSVGASCLDSRGHVITFNRAYETEEAPLGPLSVPAPPVIEYDAEGNVVHTWGDATLLPGGGTRTLPNGLHGCFVDYMDNIWVGGYRDGVVQKWTHDGQTMLLQIGEKGVCDGPATLSPDAPYPTCGSPGNNSSKTLLNNPADMFVDPEPDPVTGERGSVYIADGYGNHRVVVSLRHSDPRIAPEDIRTGSRGANWQYGEKHGAPARSDGVADEMSGDHRVCFQTSGDADSAVLVVAAVPTVDPDCRESESRGAEQQVASPV